MYDVGQNLEECSRIFDFDYDEAMGWFQVPDYEAAVDYFIDSADLDDLETIVGIVDGEWQELLVEVCVDGYEDEEFGGLTQDQSDRLRAKVKAMIPDQNYQEISEHFNLEPDYNEIYEYWIIDSSWFADQLKEYGQVVFEFGGLTIFGRCTTGQSISIDGFLRRMVRDLPEDHWVWGEA
jgi:hypothetical protein